MLKVTCLPDDMVSFLPTKHQHVIDSMFNQHAKWLSICNGVVANRFLHSIC
jgi:hypothetical protein